MSKSDFLGLRKGVQPLSQYNLQHMQTEIFLLFLSSCQKNSNSFHIISIVIAKDVHT